MIGLKQEVESNIIHQHAVLALQHFRYIQYDLKCNSKTSGSAMLMHFRYMLTYDINIILNITKFHQPVVTIAFPIYTRY